MAKIVYVIDSETTGASPPEAAVCELAAVPVQDNGKVLAEEAISSIINPGHPIPPDCRAVHHLSDNDVVKAPSLNGAMATKFSHITSGPIAAHNMAFDLPFIKDYLIDGAVTLCTYRCALHLFPTSPNHRNQTLRYFLGVEPPERYLRGLYPHRALYDAMVTAYILSYMLKQTKSLDKLIELTTAPVLVNRVHFGKHRGSLWSEVPLDYLRWVLNNDFDPDIHHTAKHYLNKERRNA